MSKEGQPKKVEITHAAVTAMQKEMQGSFERWNKFTGGKFRNIRSEIIREWFPSKWFVPSDREIEEFRNFLRRLISHHIFEAKINEPAPKWMMAVQTLRDELPSVVSEMVWFEQETFGGPLRSVELAKLLLAAQEAWIRTPYEAASLNDNKNDYAVDIANHVKEMGIRAGAAERSTTHQNSPIVKIASLAVEACGLKGALSADALAKDFKRKGITRRQRNTTLNKGKA